MNVKTIFQKFSLFLFFCRKRPLLYGTTFICEKGTSIIVGRNVKLKHCKIHVYKNSVLHIGDDTTVERAEIRVFQGSSVMIGTNCHVSDTLMLVTGKIHMGNYNICEKGSCYRPMTFEVDGNVIIGNYNRLRCVIWNRFASTLQMGDYNNVNEESEIRCDEKITIGDFNQISYRCTIWDTNTHNIYDAPRRRKLAIEKYPWYGYETERPKTIPVTIGNDNWIGKNATLMKGTMIGNRCIVGYATILCKTHVPDNKTVVQSIEIKEFPNDI